VNPIFLLFFFGFLKNLEPKTRTSVSRMCSGPLTSTLPKQGFFAHQLSAVSLVVVFWWWLVVFTWRVGLGDVMCRDVL